MKVGIIGLGVVGGAVKYGLSKIGHIISVYDVRLDTNIKDVLDAEVCFVCVPTNALDSGQCDTSIVEAVIKDLKDLNYEGVIAIKSTVAPGTTVRLQKQYCTHRICFVPEFLRERCAVADFVENHDMCVVGTCVDDVYNIVRQAHGGLPKQFIKLPPTEAELTKYFNNVYNATLITFANSFYEVCKYLNADYAKVKNAAVQRNHINDIYLDCNENFRGFGGVCLPKDTAAIDHLAQKHTSVKFFRHLLDENAKYQVTVYDGMRCEE